MANITNIQEVAQWINKDANGRAKVCTYLKATYHPELDGLASVAMDNEGEFLPEPEDGWPDDPKEMEEAVSKAKEVIYADLLEQIEAGAFDAEVVEPAETTAHKSKVSPKKEPDPEPEEEVIDPFEPLPEEKVKPKKKKQKPFQFDATSDDAKLGELMRSMLGGGELDEDRVREICREEFTKLLDKVVIRMGEFDG